VAPLGGGWPQQTHAHGDSALHVGTQESLQICQKVEYVSCAQFREREHGVSRARMLRLSDAFLRVSCDTEHLVCAVHSVHVCTGNK
jgi:hypothetical protein